MSASHHDRSRLLGEHAIVIGGSIAGLVAARVLSERFGRVTIVDRDALPVSATHRRGVPQGCHGHGLLASGLEGLTQLFPRLRQDLVDAGAVEGDVVGSVRWFQHGCYKARFDSGLGGVLLSRPLLECMVRRRVLALPNVEMTPNVHVLGLASSETRERVTGVRVQHHRPHVDVARSVDFTTFTADLVVDATGRASRAPAWLEDLGYAKPVVEDVGVDLGYTTRTYVRLPDHLDGALGAIVTPTPPKETRGGFMLAMEQDRWIVSLCGWTGDHAPATPEGFLEYARSLPRQDIYDVVRRATPLSDPVSYAIAASTRRRYERLTRLPERFLAIGDSIAAFNPVYGQGMSVATLEALELAACLDEPEGLTWIGRRFFDRAARVVDTPWTMAVGADFAFHGVTGKQPAGNSVVNWYIDHVHDAASTDHEVCRAFFKVANLLASPGSLFSPRTMWRVMRARMRDTPVTTLDGSSQEATGYSSASIARGRSDRTTPGSPVRRRVSSSAR
jgi:2-polyprenyl-6-methoxyphenol hydroxylase-like FAD-dependent oxidoreductase